jgi:mandelate racemase
MVDGALTGENFYGPRAVFQAIQARAGDYVMPDLMRIGGVTGCLRAAAIAGAAGVEMSASGCDDGDLGWL